MLYSATDSSLFSTDKDSQLAHRQDSHNPLAGLPYSNCEASLRSQAGIAAPTYPLPIHSGSLLCAGSDMQLWLR